MFKRKTPDERLKLALAKIIEDELNFEGDLRQLVITGWTQTIDISNGSTFHVTLSGHDRMRYLRA